MTSEPSIGHNSDGPAMRLAADQLRSIVERVERLNEEIKGIQSDRSGIFAEAKSNGFDLKAVRTIIRLRTQDANERAEQESILDSYMQALGML